MEFFKKKTNFPFMGTRRIWYGISILLIAISLGSLVFKGLNLAVDFTGGVIVEASFPKDPDLDRVRIALEKAGIVDPQVQNFGSSRDLSIRLPPQADLPIATIKQQINVVLTGLDPNVRISRVDVVGPQVGAELRSSSTWALIATVILIFIYVAIRFNTLKLSVGAIIAALHDPILVLGFFSLTQMTFDLAVVAAILAVVGYSLNDTVVVFDRIRERFMANKRATPVEILDESVNSTLSRTIMTSVTTLIVVATLYALGGPALEGFSAAIIVGVVVGTYSSIYIAGAIALDMGLTAESLFPTRKKLAIDDMP
jgi:preprotein translocase subunit SecF